MPGVVLKIRMLNGGEKPSHGDFCVLGKTKSPLDSARSCSSAAKAVPFNGASLKFPFLVLGRNKCAAQNRLAASAGCIARSF